MRLTTSSPRIHRLPTLVRLAQHHRDAPERPREVAHRCRHPDERARPSKALEIDLEGSGEQPRVPDLDHGIPKVGSPCRPQGPTDRARRRSQE